MEENQNKSETMWNGRRPMRGPIAAFVWVAAFLLLILAITQILSWRTIAPPAPTATISVNGEGIAYAVPDIATFSVTVSEENATVADAQTKATADGNAVISYLTANGVASADIQTSDYSINPKYQYQSAGSTASSCPANVPCVPTPVSPANQVQVGYTVSETLTVKVRTVANAGTLLGGVGKLNVQNVSSLSFTVDSPEVIENQARDLAIKDAENQAQILASQLGVHLVRVTGFNESSGNVPVPMYAMAAASSNAAVAPTPEVPAGQNQVTSDVTLTYEIR